MTTGLGPVKGYTPNFNLALVNFDWVTWHDYEHNNWSIIDAVMGNFITTSNLIGLWQNNIVTTEGERYIDPELGNIWEVSIAHTTAATGTFEDDRIANPTYWVEITPLTPIYKGIWAYTTTYNENDFVSEEGFYCIAKINHISNSSGTLDDEVAAGRWEVLVDIRSEIASVEASANAAIVSETNAAISETNATTSADNAAISEVNALASETAAGNSEIGAGVSETNAALSAADADNRAADSEGWAITPYNVPFTDSDGTSGYSALHYSIEAGGAVGTSFVSLVDTPGTLVGNENRLLAVSPDGLTVDFRDTAPTTFIGQPDAPASYTGQAGKHVTVNLAEDAVEFTDLPPSTFASLTDTPADFTAGVGRTVKINDANDGLDYGYKLEVVAALPGTPDPNTLYFILE